MPGTNRQGHPEFYLPTCDTELSGPQNSCDCNSLPVLASRRCFLQSIRPRLDQRQTQAKSRSLSRHRIEINRSVMPLQNLIGLRQPDSGPFFLGGEIQFKNLVLGIRRNAVTLVENFGW